MVEVRRFARMVEARPRHRDGPPVPLHGAGPEVEDGDGETPREGRGRHALYVDRARASLEAMEDEEARTSFLARVVEDEALAVRSLEALAPKCDEVARPHEAAPDRLSVRAGEKRGREKRRDRSAHLRRS